MKRAFTLVELMVVIGILAILMTVSIKAMSGATDSARGARCLTNLHSLAVGCQGYGMSGAKSSGKSQFAALAGSTEYEEMGDYTELHGWISWYSNGAYADTSSHKSSSSWFVSTYNDDERVRTYCLTNGSIWKAVGANRGVYTCPSHVRYADRKGLLPTWSYVMNSEFGWDTTVGSGPTGTCGLNYLSLKQTDRMLLFAELPFNCDNAAQKNFCKFGTGSGIELDPTLQYEENEVIGFNHKEGKKWYAHVCFADGHTEKLELPKNASAAQLKELTEWLCTSTPVSFNGSKYEELK